MLDTLENRSKVRIATELLANVRKHEHEVTHAQLQENVATLVRQRAEIRLSRICKGDDDEEFFATEDQIVEEAWRTIEFGLQSVIK